VVGKRVEWDAQILNPGEYSRLPDGTWHACSPNGELANLAGHKVVEHDDGTITVSPSIAVRDPHWKPGDPDRYHGFLERGVWIPV
jgi:hypothetical protein